MFDRDQDRHAWIGKAPSRGEIAALLTVGVAGMEIAGVQPVLLDALLSEHRFIPALLGWTATAELLAIGLGMWLADHLLPLRHLRWIALAAIAVTVLCDIAVLQARDVTIVALRGLAGVAEGVMIWLPTCMITRAPAPGRWAGLFLALQGLGQLAFASAVPPLVMEVYGSSGGFLVLAATALIAVIAVPFLPSHFAPLRAADASTLPYQLTPRAAIVLLSVFLIAAFSLGLFNFLGPIAQQAGLDPKVLGIAVSVSLAMQIIGPMLASMLAGRWPYYPIFAACVLVNAAVLVTLGSLPGAAAFIAASAVFGFFWLFFLPFQVPMAIEADPTRKVAMWLPTAQLLGGSTGPALGGLFVSANDFRPALMMCGACFFGAFALASTVHFRHRG